MNLINFLRLGLAICLVAVSGCAKDSVIFGTATSLAIDFSATGANIGYKNAQIATVPPKSDGMGYAVLGKSDVDISLTDLVIDEEFATGEAAECAADGEDAKVQSQA